jgi:DNA-binding transcriptional regulator YiaG
MTTQRNTTPPHIWAALRRLLNCNRQQLAARLGVSARTLRRWETLTEDGDSPGKDAAERASALLISTLAAAGDSDIYAQWRINWDAIATIGGRK